MLMHGYCAFHLYSTFCKIFPKQLYPKCGLTSQVFLPKSTVMGKTMTAGGGGGGGGGGVRVE